MKIDMYFTPPTLEMYTKEEFEDVLNASACGSNGGSYSCTNCYLGTYVAQYYSTSCK